jgi:DNA-binding response OmpR family regulator
MSPEKHRVVALVSDLMFASRIEGALVPAGYGVRVVEELEELRTSLEDQAALVLLDLHAGTTPGDVVEVCRSSGVPVLAFGRHTEPALLREARRAGCVEAVARSTLVEEMPDLVRRHARSIPA